ncbi:hypothetical protein D9M70_588260 [compost metagenome]|jgi:hypothetical protein
MSLNNVLTHLTIKENMGARHFGKSNSCLRAQFLNFRARPLETYIYEEHFSQAAERHSLKMSTLKVAPWLKL